MARPHPSRWLLFGAALGLAGCDTGPEPLPAPHDEASETKTEPEALRCDPQEGQALFEARIAPLLEDERPSSCNTCHLSGLDLATFARGTPCQSMACMAEQGIVDLDDPEESLVLRWIERADPQARGSSLVTDALVAQEYDAMLAWISFSADCGAEACEPMDDPCGDGPTSEDCALPHVDEESAYEDPGDCSDATLEALFDERVYRWRGRCMPCHAQDSDIEAPKWVAVGSCALGAAATMRAVLDTGLVDTDDPTQSLLLRKPLSEAAGGIEHGGHDKMDGTDDPAYVDMLDWIDRFAACQ